MSMELAVRSCSKADIPALGNLLNEIIEIGGTTAHETPLSEAEFDNHFRTGPSCVSCFVCENNDTGLLGFQALELRSELPDNWVSISTFARVEPKVRGVGTALFAVTERFAEDFGLQTIIATIRADNAAGLAFYEKIGFVDYQIKSAVPLLDGTPIDRQSKRFDL